MNGFKKFFAFFILAIFASSCGKSREADVEKNTDTSVRSLNFLPILKERRQASELVYYLDGTIDLPQDLRIFVYGSQTKIVDGVEKLAFYGDFPTDLKLKTDPTNGEQIFELTVGNRSAVVGSEKTKFHQCDATKDDCAFKVIQTEGNQIEIVINFGLDGVPKMHVATITIKSNPQLITLIK